MPVDRGLGYAGCRTHAWLHELNAVHPFIWLAYEQPSAPSEIIGDKHMAELGMMISIAAHIESYCEHLNISHRSVGLGAWRRTFLGKGVGEKTKTFDDWTRARLDEFGWFRPKRREEKDACGLLDHLIVLTARHSPPCRAHAPANLQMPTLTIGEER
jgi:hypothetical protein